MNPKTPHSLLFGLLLCLLTGCGLSIPSVTASDPAPATAASPTIEAIAVLLTPSRPALSAPTLTTTELPTVTATATATATTSPSPSPIPSSTTTPTFVPPTPWPTPDGPLTFDERVLLFDELWKVINERYISANFNGINWQAQYGYFRPRALNAPNDTAYYQELKEMVWLLNDDHSRFMTPNEAFDHFAFSRNEGEYVGLGLYTMPLTSGALVLQVSPGSPAERGGIQACDRILTLDGRSSWESEGGTPGSIALLVIERPGTGTFSINAPREEILQVIDVPGWVLPNRGQKIGYVRLDTLWVRDIPERLRARLREMEADGPLDGLILDLRPNLGGWRPVLQGILGIFVSGELGQFSGRLESESLIAPRADEPPPSHPELPLVVLIAPRTESYAEVLAAVLQAERGALVIGQQTRGNVETIFPRRLPFGARVWIAEQGFRLNNGMLLEGVGVRPQIVDTTDWTPYACGQDPQVERAADILETR